MPNLTIKNSVSNMGIRNDVPNVRASNFQTSRSGDSVISAGTPIGLLLTLTYAEAVALPIFGDYRPNMRVRND